MKTFAPPYGTLAILFLSLSCLLFSPMKAQTIQIDSTFTSDGEIFPFSSNDTIYGLSISGHVSLYSNTSLVRVILTDNSGQEWMVYEAYPMIVTDTAFDIVEECDETCYLEEFIPYTIQVQIINASLLLDSIIYSSEDHGNMESMQFQYKRNKDLLKIELMNEYIALHGWNWVAAENGFVNMYFYERAGYFGHNYNLLGREFYSDGVFYSVLHESIPHYSENTIIPSFDWRNKHNADIEGRPYYKFDGQDGSNGWMTLVKDQDTFNTCGAFATVAALEAAINLYANYQFDVDEQTTFSEKDAYNCSWNYGNYESGNYTLGCENDKDGKTPDSVLVKFRNEGVVNESCYPYEEPICEGEGLTCAFAINKCSDPDYTAQIAGYTKFNLFEDVIGGQAEKAAFLKEKLINYGPLIITLKKWPTDSSSGHAVCLVGFETNEDGELSWIFKNSWGLRSGNGLMGYCNEPFYLGRYLPPFPDPYPPAIADGFSVINYEEEQPITVICHQPDECSPNFNYYVHDLDLDEDGYYNWGIGPRIQNHPCGPEFEEEDSNDDNDRIGPYDDFYNGKPIMPIMKVCLLPPQSVTGRYIMHNSFFSFSEDDLDAEQYLHFYVENPGDAQLNLRPWGWGVNGERPVEITEIEGGSPNFSMDHDLDQPQSQVCMDNKNLFRIKFTGQDQGELTKVKIYLDENGEIPDFEFILVYNDCSPDQGVIEISGNQYWDSFALKTKDYVILPQATLTVTSEVAMGINSDIFVAPDGKLVIDGGRLTSACPAFWNGIDVWGDARKEQASRYQGIVEIKNGGMIEFADTAIATARFQNIYHYPSGGIISCKDAVFKDNTYDVVYYPYNNYHPVTLEIMGNASRFSRTRFETTNKYYNITHSAHAAHLKLNGVGGIRFGGCTFNNSSTQKEYSRGIGIESHDAGYTIDNFCTEDIIPCPGEQPCIFENLDYGVRAFNSNGYFTITVDSADFTDNSRGIYMSLVNDASIINNHFYLNTDEDYFEQGDILVGIYTERCTRYQIEENKISGMDPDHFELVGMHILNSLPEYNEIYNDSLVNLTTGITAAGENRHDKDHSIGLCIKCNDFIDCETDIYITYEGGEINDCFGIATSQGLPGSSAPPGVDQSTMGAGNTFSDKDPNSPKYNYYNDNNLDEIIYTYQNSNLFKLSPLPSNNMVKIPDPNPEITFLKEMSCPSHLYSGGIQLVVEKSTLISEKERLSAFSDTLSQYVDGGDTPGLALDIQTSFPDDALELRQQLLNESPYLSDTVMKLAIEKENVLPNAMVRDVLVANPQAAKSAEILYALDNKFDEMPGYMINEILEGKNVLGNRENLERKIGFHDAVKSKAFANIIRHYKNDTTLLSSKDSLIAFLENNDSPETQYQLAFSKLNSWDSVEVRNILANIPLDYFLTSTQVSTYENYEDLFEILIPLRADSVEIDSNMYFGLSGLADEVNDIPGIYARNELIYKDLVTYIEPIYLPLNNETKLDKAIIERDEFVKDSYLKVYPNPASAYLIIEYFLENPEIGAFISIYDAYGNKLLNRSFENKQNQIIIDIRTLPSGTYLIHLLNGDKIISSQKFIRIQ
jgi:hypothetical protein